MPLQKHIENLLRTYIPIISAGATDCRGRHPTFVEVMSVAYHRQLPTCSRPITGFPSPNHLEEDNRKDAEQVSSAVAAWQQSFN